MKNTIKKLLFSLRILNFFKKYLYKIALRYYKKKIDSNSSLKKTIKQIQEYGTLERHYAHSINTDAHILAHLSIQTASIINILRKRLVNFKKENDKIIDIGDPDGMFLKLITGGGYSLNILDACVRQVKRMGGIPIQGNLDYLPIRTGVIDYVICSETFEHLKNPIQGLRELARITKKKIFIIIPFTKKTRIYPSNYDSRRPEVENHVFEFNKDDFEKIATHAKLKLSFYEILNIFPKILNPVNFFILKTFYWPTKFPKFQFFELTKEVN